MIQPKLMQREQKLKLRAEAEMVGDFPDESVGVGFVTKQRNYNRGSEKHPGSSKEQGGSSEVRSTSSDGRACFCCGKVGHVKAMCRFRDAECPKCGMKGHTEAVCRRPADARGAVEQRKFSGVAFTAWDGNGDVQGGGVGTRLGQHPARHSGSESVHEVQKACA